MAIIFDYATTAGCRGQMPLQAACRTPGRRRWPASVASGARATGRWAVNGLGRPARW